MEAVQAMGGIGELAKLIGNYGVGVICLAVLLALHVYNVRVTMPSLIQSSRDQVDALSEKFQRQLETLTNKFYEELGAERKQCHEDHLRLMESMSIMQRSMSDVQTAILRLIDRFDKASFDKATDKATDK